MNEPRRKIAATPGKTGSESQKRKKENENVDWKKPLFHVIIVQGYHYFSNVWLL
jgi:hypothetical protein